MGRVWDSWGHVIAISLLTLPLVAAAALGLGAQRRRSGSADPWRTAAADVCMVAGTLPWLWMILTPGPESRAVRLVPLLDLLDVLGRDALVQVVGNLLVFLALGAFLPIRSARFAGLGRVLAVAATGSVIVEAAQYLLDLGRVSSVDDVLLNALGAGLAASLTRPWWAGRSLG